MEHTIQLSEVVEEIVPEEDDIPSESNIVSVEIEDIGHDTQEPMEVDEQIHEPKNGMKFDSFDELQKFYSNYAMKKGFAVSIRSSNKVEGVLRYVTIACTRGGKPRIRSSNPIKMRPNSKINCKAKISASLCLDGKWNTNDVEIEHNHEMSPTKSRFYKCNRSLDPHVKRRLELNDKAGIRLNKNFKSFVVEAGGPEKLPFLEKDCRNYLNNFRRLQLGDGDANAMHDYFLKMQANNSNFFYMLDLDNDGRLKNVFWADARSRAAFKEFGDVVTFDTTYLVNRYDMPFAPFVGVNHHGQSVLFGCGLISNEDTNTFMWLFQLWLTCMDENPPNAIVTDQDKAMKKAIEIVFPKARHRWCLWHIMKKVPEKLKGYKEYESIKFSMTNVVYDSLSKEEFENSWGKFIQKFNLESNKWLIGLYDERHRWVPAFVKDIFWAGMSTTQRSEEYEVREDLAIGDTHRSATFKLNFNEENSEVSCNCRLFEFRGIICRHQIMVFTFRKIFVIPEKYILARWSKMVKRRHTKIRISYDSSFGTAEVRRHDNMIKSFYEIANIADGSEEWYDFVMAELLTLKNGLKEKIESNKSPSVLAPNDSTLKESTSILDPLDVRGKGRPPENTKKSATDKAMKKKKEKLKKTKILKKDAPV